jgi:hypothetical protein
MSHDPALISANGEDHLSPLSHEANRRSPDSRTWDGGSRFRPVSDALCADVGRQRRGEMERDVAHYRQRVRPGAVSRRDMPDRLALVIANNIGGAETAR